MFINRGVAAQHNASNWLRGRLPSRRVRNLPAAVFLWALVALTALPAGVAAADPVSSSMGPAAAVASSFRALWPTLVSSYHSETGKASPRASFASSGLLSTQIMHGAPFELFLSADRATVERLVASGKSQNAGSTIAYGGISLVTRYGEDAAAELTLGDLHAGLQARDVKLAMPNPRHAPYGVAARQALSATGLWPLRSGGLLSAENASQSLQFIKSGAAAYAIVPTVLVTPTPASLRATPVPATLYQAVDHRAVLLDASGESGATFLAWLKGESAKAIFRQFGLTTQP